MKVKTMKKVILPLIFIFTFFISLITNIQAKPLDNIKFMTENSPPYNFLQNGELKGTAVELLDLMFKKVGSSQSKKDIVMLPWSRAYSYVQTEKNTVLFSTTRTKQREKLFKWVGPIAENIIALMAKKNKHIKIKSLHDITKYKIGVVREDIGEQILLNLGISSKQIENTGGVDAIHKVIKMLNRDRFEVLSYNEDSAYLEIKKLGFDVNDYERVYVLSKSELHYAFHLDTSDEIIKMFQKALDELKEEGTYEKILDKYK